MSSAAIGLAHPEVASVCLLMVVVAVTVPPGPVLLLVFRRQLAEVDVRVVVGFTSPSVIVDHFVVVPDVIIAVVGVVDPVVVGMATGDTENRRHHDC